MSKQDIPSQERSKSEGHQENQGSRDLRPVRPEKHKADEQTERRQSPNTDSRTDENQSEYNER